MFTVYASIGKLGEIPLVAKRGEVVRVPDALVSGGFKYYAIHEINWEKRTALVKLIPTVVSGSRPDYHWPIKVDLDKPLA